MTELETGDRFAGCLVGQAVGDALGFIVEGSGPDVCAEYVETALRPRRLTGRAGGAFPFGQYSDDTQLARELATSLVICGGFDPADYARRIAAIFAEDRIVGRGRATMAAAYRLAQGVRWDEAGTPPRRRGMAARCARRPSDCCWLTIAS